MVTGGGRGVAGVVGKVQGEGSGNRRGKGSAGVVGKEGEWHQEGVKGAQGTYKGSGRGRRKGSGTRRQVIEGVAEGGEMEEGDGGEEKRVEVEEGEEGLVGERHRFVKHQPGKHQ